MGTFVHWYIGTFGNWYIGTWLHGTLVYGYMADGDWVHGYICTTLEFTLGKESTVPETGEISTWQAIVQNKNADL